MGRQAEKWFKTVDKHFGFLRDAGFTHVDTDDSSFWSLWVQYRSDSAAIRVSKSNEFTRSEVGLIRLVDGEVPPYPIWITDARIDWTLLDNVVLARKPELQDEVQRQSGLKPAEIESQLDFWARTIRDVAQDFLDGDPAPIDEAAALVRVRVAAEPQQVRVYLPSDRPLVRGRGSGEGSSHGAIKRGSYFRSLLPSTQEAISALTCRCSIVSNRGLASWSCRVTSPPERLRCRACLGRALQFRSARSVLAPGPGIPRSTRDPRSRRHRDTQLARTAQALVTSVGGR